METYEKDLEMAMRQNQLLEQLSGKTVLISGAAGMIGKCLIDLLMKYNDSCSFRQKIHVIALSRNAENARRRLEEHWFKSTFYYISCDVNVGIPESKRADYIIHAASNTHPLQYAQDSVGTIASNVIGTKNLLDYAASHQTKRFCFVSSVEIYGENRGDINRFKENYLGYIDCNTLRAGYPESKRVGEALCNAYARTYQLDFVIPRLSRIYGPTMMLSDSKAIAQFIKNAAKGKDIVLKSAGTQLYSYTYVLDAVTGLLTVLLKGSSQEAYNISDSESEATLRDIAKWLAKNNDVKVVFDKSDATEQTGYSTATKALLDTEKITGLGWRPQTHIWDGLKKTVDDLKKEYANEAADFNPPPQ